MSELRLVPDEQADGPFSAGTPLPRRLPHGRHGIPAGIVAEHQRLRLLTAMVDALAKHGYAEINTTHISERANVSTATFYKHFGNLWDCALAAYVAAADSLCGEIEAACRAAGENRDQLAAGVEAALSLLAAEPALGLLLSAQTPREASSLCAARRLLVSRLAAMLRRVRDGDDDGGKGNHPPALEERLVDATLAFVHGRIAAGDAERLPAVTPELVAILGQSGHG